MTNVRSCPRHWWVHDGADQTDSPTWLTLASSAYAEEEKKRHGSKYRDLLYTKSDEALSMGPMSRTRWRTFCHQLITELWVSLTANQGTAVVADMRKEPDVGETNLRQNGRKLDRWCQVFAVDWTVDRPTQASWYRARYRARIRQKAWHLGQVFWHQILIQRYNYE